MSLCDNALYLNSVPKMIQQLTVDTENLDHCNTDCTFCKLK